MQQADLAEFDVGSMVRLVSEVRDLALGASSVEGFGQRVCELLHHTFVHDGTPQTALVRFYGTGSLESLPPDDQAYAQDRRGGLQASTTCLTLLGTAGVEPLWNDRQRSANHRVVPLLHAAQVSTMPMIAALLLQLGIDVAALAAGDPDVMLKSGDGTCRIFFIEHASGSPLIPDQDFVSAYGIASTIGFGGSLPTGEVFSVIMFCTVPVALPSAELFETVALSIRLAALDMLDLPLLQDGASSRTRLSREEILSGRHDFARALLVAHEQIAATQADRVKAALQQARYDAIRASALARVVSRLAEVQSVPEVIDVLLAEGLAALGSDGLSVALVNGSGGTVDVTVSENFGEENARTYATLPLDDTLPTTFTARTGEVVLVEDAYTDADAFPAFRDVARQVDVRAVACLPMRARGALIGALTCTWSAPRSFSPADVEHFQALATQAAQAVDRWRLLQLEREQSAALARSLLTSPPESPRCEIVARYLPAAELAQVGGDWHDSFIQKDGATVIVIGDVVGHDTAAAAAMGQVRGLLRGIAWFNSMGPAATLGAVDAAVEGLLVQTTASCLVARLERPASGADLPESVQLRWSNAGHPPPMVVEPNGSVRALTGAVPDLMLGVDPTTERTESTVALVHGATVLLYTDGLIERRGESLEDGIRRLRSSLVELATLPLPELCDAILDRMTPGAEDDIALLALRVT